MSLRYTTGNATASERYQQLYDAGPSAMAGAGLTGREKEPVEAVAAWSSTMAGAYRSLAESASRVKCLERELSAFPCGVARPSEPDRPMTQLDLFA